MRSEGKSVVAPPAVSIFRHLGSTAEIKLLALMGPTVGVTGSSESRGFFLSFPLIPQMLVKSTYRIRLFL